jgi:hypothetical protein
LTLQRREKSVALTGSETYVVRPVAVQAELSRLPEIRLTKEIISAFIWKKDCESIQ